jgi:hypothetical protein
MPVWKLIYIFICQNKLVELGVFVLIVLPANLLIGEHDRLSEISRVVVVTGDTNVSLSTLITEVIVSKSQRLLALTVALRLSFNWDGKPSGNAENPDNWIFL